MLRSAQGWCVIVTPVAPNAGASVGGNVGGIVSNTDLSRGDIVREFYEREEFIERDRGFFGGEEIIEREQIVERDRFGRERIIEREEIIERPGLFDGLFGGGREEIIEREEIIDRDFF